MISHQARSIAVRRPVGKACATLGLVVLLVAGCSVVRGTFNTVRALEKAGFSAPRIQTGNGDRFSVTVKKDTEDLDAAAVDAAGVVWRHLPLPIGRLEVSCRNGFGGRGTFAADHAELEERFGARDPDLDRGIQQSDLRTLGLVIAGLLVVGMVVLIGIVVLVVVLVRRNRRRRPPPGPWGPTGPVPQAPPPGYGPPP